MLLEGQILRNHCCVTNVTLCVNMVDDTNFVEFSVKAKPRETSLPQRKETKREPFIHTIDSLRSLMWLRHMTIHIEICCSPWKPQYLGEKVIIKHIYYGHKSSNLFLTNPSSAGVIISWHPSLLLISRKGAWSNRSSSVSVASGS